MNKIFIVLLICLMAVESYASCVCEDKVAMKESFAKAQAVFAGQVEEKIWINPYDYIVKIKLRRSWKDIKSEHAWLSSTTSEKECGYQFVTGHEYLIYAYETQNDLLAASRCDLTMPCSEVVEKDLIMLGTPIYEHEVE